MFKTYRLLIIVCLLLTTTAICNAQFGLSVGSNNTLYHADSLKSIGEYYKAIKTYKSLLSKDTENFNNIKLKISQCYSALNQTETALELLNELVYATGEENSPYLDDYVKELTKAGRFEIARMWKEKKRISWLSKRTLLDTLQNSKNIFFNSDNVEVINLDINTPEAEFCPVSYKNGIIFYSTRNQRTKKPVNIAGNSKADLFFMSRDELGFTNEVQDYNQLFGYGFYEGPFTFYNKWNNAILTKSIGQQKSSIKGENIISGLKLYQSNVDTSGNRMINLNALPFNLHGFSVAHPTITKDGKHLYFISNITGGLGGTDVYVSDNINGDWSFPKNIGSPINTVYDEMFPFIYNNTILFFASNRPGGQGGLDIYMTSLNSNKVINLGKPVNSKGNDFSFFMRDKGTEGYFTSDRIDGKGKEDIYLFRLNMEEMAHVQELRDIGINDSLSIEDIYQTLLQDTISIINKNNVVKDSVYQNQIQSGDSYQVVSESVEEDTEKYHVGYSENLPESVGDNYSLALQEDNVSQQKKMDKNVVGTTPNTMELVEDVSIGEQTSLQKSVNVNGNVSIVPPVLNDKTEAKTYSANNNQIESNASYQVTSKTPEEPVKVSDVENKSEKINENFSVAVGENNALQQVEVDQKFAGEIDYEVELQETLNNELKSEENTTLDPIQLKQTEIYNESIIENVEEINPVTENVNSGVEVIEEKIVESSIVQKEQVFEKETDIKQNLEVINEDNKHLAVAPNNSASTINMSKQPKYRVQIAASIKPMTEQELRVIYKGQNKISEFTEEGYYKYYIGEFENFFEAKQLKNLCKVKGAFIAAYYENEKQDLMRAVYNQYTTEKDIIIDKDLLETNVPVSVKKVIYYSFDKYNPKDDAELNLFISQLKEMSLYKIELHAFTDIFGSFKYNFGLSVERAKKIKNYLIEKGISADKIFICPHGETNKFTSNGQYSITKHAGNRRTEILVYENSRNLSHQ